MDVVEKLTINYQWRIHAIFRLISGWWIRKCWACRWGSWECSWCDWSLQTTVLINQIQGALRNIEKLWHEGILKLVICLLFIIEMLAILMPYLLLLWLLGRVINLLSNSMIKFNALLIFPNLLNLLIYYYFIFI